MGYVMPRGLTRDERLQIVMCHSWDRRVRNRARQLLEGADLNPFYLTSWRFWLFGRTAVTKASTE